MNGPMATLPVSPGHGAIIIRGFKKYNFKFFQIFFKNFFSKNHHFFSVNIWDINFIP